METSPAVVKARAAAQLRVALVEGSAVSAALRRCFYQNPAFAATLFTEATRQWFGLDCDVRSITSFIFRAAQGQLGTSASLPRREAEALVRGALGEVALLEEVDPHKFSYAEISIVLLNELFAEWRPTGVDVAALFDRTDTILAEVHKLSPELASAEDDWFAEGMPNSPFVVFVESSDKAQEGRATGT